MDELNRIVGRDIKKWVNLIVGKLSTIVDDFELFCQKKKRYKTRRELYNEFEDFFQRLTYYIGVCDVPVFIERAVTDKIFNELKRKKIKNIYREFSILTTYLKDTYINEEEKNLLRIAARLNRQKSHLNNLKEFKKSPLYQEVINHTKKYTWMGIRLFLGEEHHLDYFFQRIKKNLGTARNKLEKIEKRQKQNKELFEKTIKKLNLDRELLECAQLLMWIRDKRYMGITRGSFYKRNLFRGIAQRGNLDLSDLFYLLPQEIKEILKENKNVNLNLINQRKKGFALFLKKGRVSQPVVGKELIQLKKEKIPPINKLKGNPAHPGKLKGKVRIVLDDEDLSRFKKGEILVTNMTTPDYINIMKKAAAIVTDLGGITCHAAIISRELDIPCVVGTNVATRALKTGDWVEVDAERGMVKKISK